MALHGAEQSRLRLRRRDRFGAESLRSSREKLCGHGLVCGVPEGMERLKLSHL